MKALGLFLKKIQRSDESVKRKWFIGLSIIASILIVSFWGYYVSTTIPNTLGGGTTPSSFSSLFESFQKNEVSEPAPKPDTEKTPSANEEHGETQKPSAEASLIKKTRDVVIEAPETNFYFSGTETFPTSALPIAPVQKNILKNN